jgi:hypothetical protein
MSTLLLKKNVIPQFRNIGHLANGVTQGFSPATAGILQPCPLRQRDSAARRAELHDRAAMGVP